MGARTNKAPRCCGIIIDWEIGFTGFYFGVRDAEHASARTIGIMCSVALAQDNQRTFPLSVQFLHFPFIVLYIDAGWIEPQFKLHWRSIRKSESNLVCASNAPHSIVFVTCTSLINCILKYFSLCMALPFSVCRWKDKTISIRQLHRIAISRQKKNNVGFSGVCVSNEVARGCVGLWATTKSIYILGLDE